MNYGWADVKACEEIENTFYGTRQRQIYPREDKMKIAFNIEAKSELASPS